jgi:uncharacterized protein (TIGR02271 family)
MAQTVIGIFDNETQARSAVETLVENGISRERIDVSDSRSSMADSSYTGRYNETDADMTDRRQSLSDSTYGDRRDDEKGSAIGRFFRSLFSDDDDVEKYSTVARTGTIVAVHSEDSQEAKRASEILDSAGAVDVDDRFMNTNYEGRTYQSGETDQHIASVDSSDDTIRDRSVDRLSDDTTSIPIVEEQLNVGKREVETGAVRIRSRIIEKPVEETLRLREQTVVIERTPVDRTATGADTNFKEGEIEIRKTREVPVVNKEARVVEEVNVRKDVREHEETVRDTVRRTDVEVNETDDDTVVDKTKKKRGI